GIRRTTLIDNRKTIDLIETESSTRLFLDLLSASASAISQMGQSRALGFLNLKICFIASRKLNFVLHSNSFVFARPTE
ncbi:MAG TPA: hypothetical protein VLI42_09300, partial [Chthoniobacterales bacterium]|nr:hypothetical protein [Chthoniobacterales bacterium]